MKITTTYPWSEMQVGDSFFVPTLAIAKTREAGLKAAMQHRYRAKATPGTYRGLFGVMFTRRS